MRVLLGIMLLSLSVGIAAAEPSLNLAEAKDVFYQATQRSDKSGGFWALEMPKMRDFSPDVPITVDEECLRFAIVLSYRDKPMCRKHAEITKLAVSKYTEKSLYGRHLPGDHSITVFYKGFGKMAVFDLDGGEVDRFISAVRVLSPRLKKVKDYR